MAEGNHASPFRRSSHRGASGGHFSPMHTSEESANSGDQNLWDNFESVACSVTDLYRNPSWNVFQRTAAATTQFYKDSVDAYRRGTDSGVSVGRQLLCKEILHWLQTSNQISPYIRRDEVINFVLTRAVMAPSTSETGAGQGAAAMANSNDLGNSSPMQTQHHDSPSTHPSEPLEIFQEALAVAPSRQNATNANQTGLTAFFVEEFRRHGSGKRRRLSPEHQSYYLHSNHSSSESSPDNSGSGGYWHGRPPKRSRRV